MDDDPAARRLAALGSCLAIVAAVVVTVVGIVTGVGTQRADGVAAVSTIRAQVIVGALAVTLMVVGLGAALSIVAKRTVRPRWAGAWLVATILLWLLWAICRSAVDAS